MNNLLIDLFKKGRNANNIIYENEQNQTFPPPKIENFLKIDQKNSFSEIKEYEIENIKKRINDFKGNEELIKSNINTIMNKLLEKNSNSNFSNDIFIISQNISKLVCKNNKISKDNIDSVINYLIKNNKNKNNIYKSNKILLNKKKCEIIGSVLCYSFSRLQSYKIKDINKLIEIRKTILDKGIDVHKDFMKYCKDNKVKDKKITYYWKSQRSKYILLPELIFLINRYSQVTEIELDFNLFDETLNKDETQTQLIELTILNIHWLFNSLKNFKINLINEKFEDLINKYYLRKIRKINTNYNESFKKNRIANENNFYKKKWNFIDNFKLEENREISTQLAFTLNSTKSLISRQSLPFEDIIKSRTLSITDSKRKTIAVSFQDKIRLFDDFNLNNVDKENIKDLNQVIKLFHFTLELIIMALYSFSIPHKCNDFEIVMNDSYNWEFLTFFKTFLGFETLDDNMSEFNILDILIYNKINITNRLNIEINSLDYTTFENLLNIINDNHSLFSINLSFFSSDVVYSPQFMFKICKESSSLEDFIKKFKKEESTYLFKDIIDIEEKILNKLSPFFIQNLSMLFEIIKDLENLNELCLNFEIPNNLITKTNYTNPILKFMLNILVFTLNISKLKKLCLLSPKTILDNRAIPNIDNLLKSINANDCLLLKDLSLHFQFYQISNINNFVNTRLQILNIGDLDMDTFRTFTKKICDPIFNLNSFLQKLSIGLINTIVNFNIELKLLIRKLFSIKIKNLETLNLYTNIIIDNEIDYDYFLQILNNNWISEYTILFNCTSELIITDFPKDIKNLKFFVPHNLEKKLLEPDDIMAMKDHPMTLEVDNNKDYYDDAYWYLKFLFENIYVDKFKNENRIKNMIMGILKYLYFLKTPRINHPIV